jgi:hypothetical protein
MGARRAQINCGMFIRSSDGGLWECETGTIFAPQFLGGFHERGALGQFHAQAAMT